MLRVHLFLSMHTPARCEICAAGYRGWCGWDVVWGLVYQAGEGRLSCLICNRGCWGGGAGIKMWGEAGIPAGFSDWLNRFKAVTLTGPLSDPTREKGRGAPYIPNT